MSSIPGIILLFIIVLSVAVSVRRWLVPYAVALVLVGLPPGHPPLLSGSNLTHGLIFLVILPGLIFEVAYHIDFDRLWHGRPPILSLAVPGIAVAIAPRLPSWRSSNSWGPPPFPSREPESCEKERASAQVAEKLLADSDTRLLKIGSGSPFIPADSTTQATEEKDRAIDPSTPVVPPSA